MQSFPASVESLAILGVWLCPCEIPHRAAKASALSDQEQEQKGKWDILASLQMWVYENMAGLKSKKDLLVILWVLVPSWPENLRHQGTNAPRVAKL